MKAWFKILVVLAITIVIFNVEGVLSLKTDKKVASNKSRLNRRKFGSPDPEQVLSIAKTGLTSFLVVLQQIIDREYSQFKEKPAAIAKPNAGIANPNAGIADPNAAIANPNAAIANPNAAGKSTKVNPGFRR